MFECVLVIFREMGWVFEWAVNAVFFCIEIMGKLLLSEYLLSNMSLVMD